MVDLILERRDVVTDIEHVCLLGNHEDALFNEFLIEPNGLRQDWLYWGGVEAAKLWR